MAPATANATSSIVWTPPLQQELQQGNQQQRQTPLSPQHQGQQRLQQHSFQQQQHQYQQQNCLMPQQKQTSLNHREQQQQLQQRHDSHQTRQSQQQQPVQMNQLLLLVHQQQVQKQSHQQADAPDTFYGFSCPWPVSAPAERKQPSPMAAPPVLSSHNVASWHLGRVSQESYGCSAGSTMLMATKQAANKVTCCDKPTAMAPVYIPCSGVAAAGTAASSALLSESMASKSTLSESRPGTLASSGSAISDASTSTGDGNVFASALAASIESSPNSPLHYGEQPSAMTEGLENQFNLNASAKTAPSEEQQPQQRTPQKTRVQSQHQQQVQSQPVMHMSSRLPLSSSGHQQQPRGLRQQRVVDGEPAPAARQLRYNATATPSTPAASRFKYGNRSSVGSYTPSIRVAGSRRARNPVRQPHDQHSQVERQRQQPLPEQEVPCQCTSTGTEQRLPLGGLHGDLRANATPYLKANAVRAGDPVTSAASSAAGSRSAYEDIPVSKNDYGAFRHAHNEAELLYCSEASHTASSCNNPSPVYISGSRGETFAHAPAANRLPPLPYLHYNFRAVGCAGWPPFRLGGTQQTSGNGPNVRFRLSDVTTSNHTDNSAENVVGRKKTASPLPDTHAIHSRSSLRDVGAAAAHNYQPSPRNHTASPTGACFLLESSLINKAVAAAAQQAAKSAAHAATAAAQAAAATAAVAGGRCPNNGHSPQGECAYDDALEHRRGELLPYLMGVGSDTGRFQMVAFADASRRDSFTYDRAHSPTSRPIGSSGRKQGLEQQPTVTLPLLCRQTLPKQQASATVGSGVFQLPCNNLLATATGLSEDKSSLVKSDGSRQAAMNVSSAMCSSMQAPSGKAKAGDVAPRAGRMLTPISGHFFSAVGPAITKCGPVAKTSTSQVTAPVSEACGCSSDHIGRGRGPGKTDAAVTLHRPVDATNATVSAFKDGAVQAHHAENGQRTSDLERTWLKLLSESEAVAEGKVRTCRCSAPIAPAVLLRAPEKLEGHVISSSSRDIVQPSFYRLLEEEDAGTGGRACGTEAAVGAASWLTNCKAGEGSGVEAETFGTRQRQVSATNQAMKMPGGSENGEATLAVVETLHLEKLLQSAIYGAVFRANLHSVVRTTRASKKLRQGDENRHDFDLGFDSELNGGSECLEESEKGDPHAMSACNNPAKTPETPTKYLTKRASTEKETDPTDCSDHRQDNLLQHVQSKTFLEGNVGEKPHGDMIGSIELRSQVVAVKILSLSLQLNASPSLQEGASPGRDDTNELVVLQENPTLLAVASDADQGWHLEITEFRLPLLIFSQQAYLDTNVASIAPTETSVSKYWHERAPPAVKSVMDLSGKDASDALVFVTDFLSELKFYPYLKGHKNILVPYRIYVDRAQQLLMLIFPFAEFEDLFEVLKKRKKPFAEPEVQWICKQLLQAILFLHKRGIAMRDLSLENVLICRCPETGFAIPKLTDPGQAVIADRESAAATRKAVTVKHCCTAGDCGLHRRAEGDLERKVDAERGRERCLGAGQACVKTAGLRSLLDADEYEPAAVFLAPDKIFGKSFRPPEVYQQCSYNPFKVDSFCMGWMTYYLLTKQQLFQRAAPSDENWRLLSTKNASDLLLLLGKKNGAVLSVEGLDFVVRLLEDDPERRMTIYQALAHPFIALSKPRPVLADNLFPEDAAAQEQHIVKQRHFHLQLLRQKQSLLQLYSLRWEDQCALRIAAETQNPPEKQGPPARSGHRQSLLSSKSPAQIQHVQPAVATQSKEQRNPPPGQTVLRKHTQSHKRQTSHQPRNEHGDEPWQCHSQRTLATSPYAAAVHEFSREQDTHQNKSGESLFSQRHIHHSFKNCTTHYGPDNEETNGAGAVVQEEQRGEAPGPTLLVQHSALLRRSSPTPSTPHRWWSAGILPNSQSVSPPCGVSRQIVMESEKQSGHCEPPAPGSVGRDRRAPEMNTPGQRLGQVTESHVCEPHFNGDFVVDAGRLQSTRNNALLPAGTEPGTPRSCGWAKTLGHAEPLQLPPERLSSKKTSQSTVSHKSSARRRQRDTPSGGHVYACQVEPVCSVPAVRQLLADVSVGPASPVEQAGSSQPQCERLFLGACPSGKHTISDKHATPSMTSEASLYKSSGKNSADIRQISTSRSNNSGTSTLLASMSEMEDKFDGRTCSCPDDDTVAHDFPSRDIIQVSAQPERATARNERTAQQSASVHSHKNAQSSAPLHRRTQVADCMHAGTQPRVCAAGGRNTLAEANNEFVSSVRPAHAVTTKQDKKPGCETEAQCNDQEVSGQRQRNGALFAKTSSTSVRGRRGPSSSSTETGSTAGENGGARSDSDYCIGVRSNGCLNNNTRKRVLCAGSDSRRHENESIGETRATSAARSKPAIETEAQDDIRSDVRACPTCTAGIKDNLVSFGQVSNGAGDFFTYRASPLPSSDAYPSAVQRQIRRSRGCPVADARIAACNPTASVTLAVELAGQDRPNTSSTRRHPAPSRYESIRERESFDVATAAEPENHGWHTYTGTQKQILLRATPTTRYPSF